MYRLQGAIQSRVTRIEQNHLLGGIIQALVQIAIKTKVPNENRTISFREYTWILRRKFLTTLSIEPGVLDICQ